MFVPKESFDSFVFLVEPYCGLQQAEGTISGRPTPAPRSPG